MGESESRSVMSNSLPPHGLVHGILQARILEWVAIAFPGDLLNAGVEHRSPIAGGFFTSCATREAQITQRKQEFMGLMPLKSLVTG